ncbi:MAG: efflux RND transporter periplasmic adaptor subunit [Ectothiorhodospiraceae bacterium]|nr:efflux RND transporter periplasmic adaptor subunit [Ectothiorhodospiraceae bacterium]
MIKMRQPGIAIQWGWPGALSSVLLGIMLGVMPGMLIAQEMDATLLWGNKMPLGTPVSGVVATVNVIAGDAVKKGDVLMALDDRILRASVQARTAALKSTTNDRDEAERELTRTQEMYDRTLISDHDLALAVIQRDAAITSQQIAKASLVKAEIDLWHSQLRAPFDAWVIRRDVAVGQTIVSRLQATPLLVLVEAKFMLARVHVSTEQLSAVRNGEKAVVSVNGKSYTGIVYFISLEPVEKATTQYVVDVKFTTGKPLLRAGLPAKVIFQ